MTTNDLFGDVTHSYSRAEALDDGALVDAGDLAREAGLRFPVALTRSVWDRFVEVPEGVACQDVTGRLWDVLWMTRCAIVGHRGQTDRIAVELFVRNDNRRPKRVHLVAVCGPGDGGEPVVTIMLPEED